MEITGGEVEAAEIRRLLIDADALDPAGLVVTGARILGQLDLRDLVVKRPLSLHDCTTEEPILVNRAHFSRLDLRRLVAPAVLARGLTVDHNLRLSGARLSAAESFDGLNMRIGGSAYLDDGFHAAGSVVLSSSRVAGVVSCRGARVDWAAAKTACGECPLATRRAPS